MRNNLSTRQDLAEAIFGPMTDADIEMLCELINSDYCVVIMQNGDELKLKTNYETDKDVHSALTLMYTRASVIMQQKGQSNEATT